MRRSLQTISETFSLTFVGANDEWQPPMSVPYPSIVSL
jgi:hypothetical protein